MTLLADTVVLVVLLADWLLNMHRDWALRIDLNRLRAGHFAIRSRRQPPARGTATGSGSGSGSTRATGARDRPAEQ